MHEIKAWIDTSNTESTRYELWTMLKERKLGLITNEECLDTDTKDVTPEVAEKVSIYLFSLPFLLDINFSLCRSSGKIKKRRYLKSTKTREMKAIMTDLMLQIW